MRYFPFCFNMPAVCLLYLNLLCDFLGPIFFSFSGLFLGSGYMAPQEDRIQRMGAPCVRGKFHFWKVGFNIGSSQTFQDD